MLIVLPLIAALVIAGNLTGNYLESQAKDVIQTANVVSLSKALDSYYIFNSTYPKDLNELQEKEEIKILGTFTYLRSPDGQRAALSINLELDTVCWRSEGVIAKIKSIDNCNFNVDPDGFEPSTPTL